MEFKKMVTITPYAKHVLIFKLHFLTYPALIQSGESRVMK